MSSARGKQEARQSRTRLSRTERRSAIIDAATRAFAAGGFAATSMSDVAAAAGVTPLILYRHFDGKDDLYRAVLQRSVDRLRRHKALRPSTRGLGIDVAAALAAARHDPDGFRLLWRHASRETGFASFAEKVSAVAVAAQREQLRDRVPDRGLLDWAAQASVNYVIEAVLSWIELGDIRHDERFVRSTTHAMRAGIRTWSQT